MKCRIRGIACQGDWLAQNGDCDEGPDKGCLYEELSILSEQLAEYRDAEKFVADPPHDQECCGCVGILRKQLKAAEGEVERLKAVLDKLARLGNEPELGNSKGNVIAQQALKEKPE